MDNATASEVRRTDGALTSVTGALLAERLLTATGNHAARLGCVRALTACSKLSDDDLVHQRDVGLNVKDLCGEVDGAGLLTLQVKNIDGTDFRHDHAPFTAERTSTMPFLGPGIAPEIRSRPFSTSTA